MKAAARPLPAPGWFLGTIAGLPGMKRARWRRDQARIDVVAAADVGADDEVDGLAGVEIRGRRGSCHEDGDQRNAAAQNR